MPDHAIQSNETPKTAINKDLQRAILKTITFFDLFDFPLTVEELFDRLYQYGKPLHIKELRGTLKQMEEKWKLEIFENYVTLKGRGAILAIRKKRQFISQKLWEKVNWYGRYLKNIPFIKMIAVCNNLAYNNSSEESDIDLFIVIQSGRMWLGRFFMTIILHFFGVRRYGNKVAGRFCLSFFVTEKRLKIEVLELKPQDPYLAYWTQTLTPIYGEKMYGRFVNENESWLKENYGLRFNEKKIHHLVAEKKSRWKSFWEWILGGWLGNFCEGILKATLKKKTLKAKESLDEKSNVVISDNMLKFHNHDRRQEYFEKWKEKMNNI